MNNFELRELTVGVKHWKVYRALIDFSCELFRRAKYQAAEKAKYTMTAGQDGVERSQQLKEQRQLMGTLAEIYVQDLINSFLKSKGVADWQVVRYDDIRTDGFKSPENEFDLRLEKNDGKTFFMIESRSSIIKDRTLTKALESFHIIGPYISSTKRKEESKDYYILPLHYFKIFDRVKFLPSKFEENLREGNIDLYIVGGCSKEDMEKRGYKTSLGQAGTEYLALDAIDGQDVVQMLEYIYGKTIS